MHGTHFNEQIHHWNSMSSILPITVLSASTDITEISSPFSYENTSASTTAEHSSRDPGFSTSSHMNLCACRCVRVTASASPNEIEKKMHNTSANLLLAKKNLSSYTRRLKSAEDDRLSSKTMGLLGVSVIVTVILIIIMSDVIRLIKYITRS